MADVGHWINPVDIVYGTQMSNFQLDASASAPETCVYTSPSETVLNAGDHKFHVDFTPGCYGLQERLELML